MCCREAFPGKEKMLPEDLLHFAKFWNHPKYSLAIDK
jgi:hypothetical protein